MCRVRGACQAVLVWTLVAVTTEGSPSRLVELAQGPVRGYKDAEYDIYVFNSIPYAKAPTGTERYKSPLPPPVWTEVFEAVDKGIICPQKDFMGFITNSTAMQEDCLIANVYVPETKEKKLPVVVYVHGGAYLMGSGNFITPKNIVETKKIIAVTFNYRLGAHGFLCLGTKDVPGNAGMKDQVALLRWVKKNIARFGGNPDEITIDGYSAGSSSVDLLMISKLTNNLFKRVIPESGANTAAFSIQTDPLKNAKEYANLISSDKTGDTRFEDFHALEDFYKTISYEQLNSGFYLDKKDSTFFMSPCVENDLGQEIFLDDSPVNILKSGNYRKVPMLYGFANMEGLFRIPVFDQWKDLMNAKFSDFLPADLKFKNEAEKEEVAEIIKRFYFGEQLINEKTVLQYVDYFTDIIFAYPTLRSVKLQVQAGNDQIYLYEYSYTNDDTPVVPYTNIRGANHCAQTFGVLDGYFDTAPIEEKNISDDLKKHKKVMREIWLNFMTTGKPVSSESKLPAWPPVSSNWSPHMSLNRTIQLKGSLLEERNLFWENIYEKYYYNPLPPIFTAKHTEL